jgi:large conductance mechanosensitive channel
MGMMQEFRDFAIKGNVVDLAVGVIIGGAFGKIVDSLVKDIIMPVIGAIIGNVDFSNKFVTLGTVPADFKGAITYAEYSKAGISMLAWGNFLTILINFIILAFVIFQMIKAFNRLKGKANLDAAAAPPPEDIVLLREIRDSLKK